MLFFNCLCIFICEVSFSQFQNYELLRYFHFLKFRIVVNLHIELTMMIIEKRKLELKQRKK